LALTLTGCQTVHQSKQEDYKVIYGNGSFPLEPQIKEAAAEGWRVVSLGGGDSVVFVIMARPQ
jgi:hypothetical protein